MPKYESIVESRAKKGKLAIPIPYGLLMKKRYPFNRICASHVYLRAVPENESALDVYKLAMFGAGASAELEEIILPLGKVFPFKTNYTNSAVLHVQESQKLPFKSGDRVGISIIERESVGLRIEKIG